MKVYIFILTLILIPLQIYCQFEQYVQEDTEPKSQPQAGIAFSVVESGTGLGGFYARPFNNFWNIGATINFFMIRDSKQYEYADYYYGYYTVNKKNNVYLIDLLFSVKKRLFAEEIDNSLQPFLAISLGPVYGMNFPEQEGLPDQYRWALSGAGAAGIDVALEGNTLIGMRLQYRYMKFDAKLGERSDHSMFDVRLEIGKLF
jgi:hypothetical protein